MGVDLTNPDRVSVEPAAAGDGYILLVDGLQTGPGPRDSDGSSGHVFASPQAALQWLADDDSTEAG